MLILKMSIIPMVENALIHAYKDDANDVDICVSVRREENAIIIEVSDKGVGMTPERIQQVLSGSDTKKKFNRIGLRNIIDRIRLYFGPEYNLEIESVQGESTTIRIKHPILTEQEWEIRKGGNHA